MTVVNPFITQGYLSPHYFCDRVEETKYLTDLVVNGNNVVLISPRRLGKTGLICHCFEQSQMKDHYHTFIVDIYATKNLQELVFYLGKSILGTLKPQGRKVWERFVNTLSSLRSSISFDINGQPEWGLGVGDVKAPQTTSQRTWHGVTCVSAENNVFLNNYRHREHYIFLFPVFHPVAPAPGLALAVELVFRAAQELAYLHQ